MAGSKVDPLFCVGAIDAAANLESGGISRNGFFGRDLVAGSKLNDVSAQQSVSAKHFGEVRAWMAGNKVFSCTFVCQRAADDLFYLAVVKVDAGPEK